MASAEASAAGAAPKTEEKKERKPQIPTFAFEFTIPKEHVSDKATVPQIKAKVNDAFTGYGAPDECRVAGEAGADRIVTIFFSRLFGKGQPAWDALKKGEKSTITIYDQTIDLRMTDAKPSGGGLTTQNPKKEKEPKKAGGRGRGRGRGRGDGAPGEEAKDGGRGRGRGEDGEGGRGRGRGRREDEEKKDTLQRGRANIGGKLGQLSKIRLAKLEKEKRDKENAARIARGEKPLEEVKKEEEPEAKKEEKGKKPAAGKKEAPKGKAEAAKSAGKKEGAKKGK